MTDRRAPGRRKATRGSVTSAPVGGKRRASRSRPRRTLLSILPTTPVLAGVSVLAVAAGGAVTVSDASMSITSAPSSSQARPHAAPANALSGTGAVASANLLEKRNEVVSRDSERQALADSTQEKIVDAAEKVAQQRNVALMQTAQAAEKQAKLLALNQWVLPVDSYRLTNTFGMARSYYSSGYHTGLDFAAPSGTPIRSVANGVVTSVGYDGSYGNKTVITLEDGYELWYCHQSAYAVSVGETVRAGEVIGYVGSTGNSTGPHLHLEVRPGGGDPVDPDAALQVHGLHP